jgi:RNA polymerase sigma-70 factor, ECF subfamily
VEERPNTAAAFGAFYEAHRRPLHAFLLGRCGDPEAARELLQDLFVRAWRNLPVVALLPPPRQRAWLFAVARNLLADAHRRRAARPQTESLDALAGCSGPPEDEPAAAAEYRAQVEALDGAIRALPEDLRTVLLMQVLAGMHSAQIGESLGKPAGTIRYQLLLARRRLAEQMGLFASPPPPEPVPERTRRRSQP